MGSGSANGRSNWYASMSVTSIGALDGFPTSVGPDGTQVVFPTPDRYHDVIAALKSAGFEMLADLCGVDYLGHPERHVPGAVNPERFEVVVNLLSLSSKRRLRVRVQVAESQPTLDSIFDLYPGSEAMEREAYDLMGISFKGHPDLTRILMPDDWEGHPLRKDFAIGRVPVQFKETPGPR